MNNKRLKEMNIDIYGYICMAGYDIGENNPIILHHTIPLASGGRRTFENTAIITTLAHSGIHLVSYDSKQRAREIVNHLLAFKNNQDVLVLKQFSEWLKEEVDRLGYVESLTKNNLLIYRRNRK